MLQSLLLIALVLLCIFLIISIIRKPFEREYRNLCNFKILPPKFGKKDGIKWASFSIAIEKKHKFFINFPLLFKFYSDSSFISDIKIFYKVSGDDKKKVLDKEIEFREKAREHIVYITDVILGELLIEINVRVIEGGDPIVGFEIMKNSTCDLKKEYKMELDFSKI